MITIKKEVELAFNRADVDDIIRFVPLMDMLVMAFTKESTLRLSTKNGEEKTISPQEVEQIYYILREFGFGTTQN